MSPKKSYKKVSSEVTINPTVVSQAFSDKHIFDRICQWLDDGDKGVTITHIISTFRTSPQRAKKLLENFYSENHEEYDLKRGWFVEPETKENFDEDGGLIEYVGYTATEDKVNKMEKEGKVVEKRLYCIHPKNLDTIYNINLFDFKRMDSKDSKVTRKPLSIKPDAYAMKAREEKKRKDEVKIEKLFAKECQRPKNVVASPKGPKYPTPIKSKDDFFTPSPSKKQKTAENEESKVPPKKGGRRKLEMETSVKIEDEDSDDDLMMDDVFTKDDEDNTDIEDVEDAGKEELGKRPRKTAKVVVKPAETRTKKSTPRDTSNKSKTVKEEVVEEDIEMDDEPEVVAGSSSKKGPNKIREMKLVPETTRDEEGFLVTSLTKKIVESDATSTNAPPQAKKKAPAPAPAVKKGGKGGGAKHQSSLMDFFKKK